MSRFGDVKLRALTNLERIYELGGDYWSARVFAAIAPLVSVAENSGDDRNDRSGRMLFKRHDSELGKPMLFVTLQPNRSAIVS